MGLRLLKVSEHFKWNPVCQQSCFPEMKTEQKFRDSVPGMIDRMYHWRQEGQDLRPTSDTRVQGQLWIHKAHMHISSSLCAIKHTDTHRVVWEKAL